MMENDETTSEPVAAAEAAVDDAVQALEAVVDTAEGATSEVADAAGSAIAALALRVERLEALADRSVSAAAEHTEETVDEAIEEAEGVPVVIVDDVQPNIASTNESFARKLHNVLG